MDDTCQPRDYFRALYEMAVRANATPDTKEALKHIVRSVSEGLGVKGASLRLVDRSGLRLVLAASHGLSRAYLDKGPVLIEESALDRKALEPQAVYVEDAALDSGVQYPEKARAEGIRSLLVMPVWIQGRSVGVLRAYSATVRGFEEEAFMFLEAAVHLTALILEKGRLNQALRGDYLGLLPDRDRPEEA